jgi:hypothetical protein
MDLMSRDWLNDETICAFVSAHKRRLSVILSQRTREVKRYRASEAK